MSSPVRHVVRRQEYTPPTAAGVRRVLPGKWAVAATSPRPADAAAECGRLLAQAHRTLNPFQLGGPGLFYQTSLPAYALHDYLLDHDLPPPPATTSPNYVFWWVKNHRTFTAEQRAAVWRACDKLTPFAVAEVDDRRSAWLVAENEWLAQADRGAGSCWVQAGERFHLREGYGTRREAERARARREGELRDEGEDDGQTYFAADGRTYDWAAAPFFSTLAVPVVGDPPAGTAYVVARRWVSAEGGVRPDLWEQLGYGDQLEPLFAVADAEAADGHARGLARAARRTANPFALVGDEFFRPPLSTHAVTEAAPDELPNGLTLPDALAALRRLDTTPPPPDADALLADWYDRVVQWSPEFVDVIWGTFADFRLFEVVEVPFGT